MTRTSLTGYFRITCMSKTKTLPLCIGQLKRLLTSKWTINYKWFDANEIYFPEHFEDAHIQ